MKNKKVSAILSWSLRVKCPHCQEDICLEDHDDDDRFSFPLFSNQWDKIEGEEVECPDCGEILVIESVEY